MSNQNKTWKRGYVSHAAEEAWKIRVNHEDHAVATAWSPRRSSLPGRRPLKETLDFAHAVVSRIHSPKAFARRNRSLERDQQIMRLRQNIHRASVVG